MFEIMVALDFIILLKVSRIQGHLLSEIIFITIFPLVYNYLKLRVMFSLP